MFKFKLELAWGKEEEMTFSEEKIVMVLLKGNVLDRFVQVKMEDTRIRAWETLCT